MVEGEVDAERAADGEGVLQVPEMAGRARKSSDGIRKSGGGAGGAEDRSGTGDGEATERRGSFAEGAGTAGRSPGPRDPRRVAMRPSSAPRPAKRAKQNLERKWETPDANGNVVGFGGKAERSAPSTTSAGSQSLPSKTYPYPRDQAVTRGRDAQACCSVVAQLIDSVTVSLQVPISCQKGRRHF